MAGVERRDAAREKAAHLRPLARDGAPEQRQPDPRVGAPQRAPRLNRRLAELERRDPSARLDDARQLAQRRGRIIDVAQQVGEGEVVELAVGERQPLGLTLEQRDARCELRRAGQTRPRRGKHLRALIEPDHLDAVAVHEVAGDHPGAGRHIEHPLARARVERRHHRRPPARVLTEAQRGPDSVIVARQAGEQRKRMLLARPCRVGGEVAGRPVVWGGVCAGRSRIMPRGERGRVRARMPGSVAAAGTLPAPCQAARDIWSCLPTRRRTLRPRAEGSH